MVHRQKFLPNDEAQAHILRKSEPWVFCVQRTLVNFITEDPFGYVLGFVPIVNQTAENVVQFNPRHLIGPMNFSTVFSLGPMIATVMRL